MDKNSDFPGEYLGLHWFWITFVAEPKFKSMKKTLSIIMTIAALGFSSAAFAQKPAAGAVTGEIQLNFQTGSAPISVVAPALNFRYFLAEDMAARLKFGILTSSYKPAGGDKVTSSTIIFSPAIEKHFKGTEKLSPYVGAELSIQSGKDELETKSSSFGLGLIFGGDYYFAQNVYCGAEVSWGYSSTSTTPAGLGKSTSSGLGLSTNSGIRLGMIF